MLRAVNHPLTAPASVHCNVLRLLFAASALALSLAAHGAAPALRPEIEAFIEEMGKKHGYEPALLRRMFRQVQTRPSILRAMSAPGTARPWFEYRRRIVEPTRIDNGVRFWLENTTALERARREFGVPEELIVATIGIETLYGRNMGSFKVLDALSTLAFEYPPRGEFFRGELEEYLLLARESGMDALNTRGSYAGAIGIPQFLPSSYRKYAIDFDGDGRRDLVASTADAIGSVANYYRSFGWKTGAPVIVPADSGDAELGPLLAAGIRPHIKVSELKSRGLVVQEPVDDNAEATLFFLQMEAGPKLMLGLNNFYVITRYNRSINYAMAVHELAVAIRAQVK
jgi:membrane-bound lytic murein transglycosylase B